VSDHLIGILDIHDSSGSHEFVELFVGDFFSFRIDVADIKTLIDLAPNICRTRDAVNNLDALTTGLCFFQLSLNCAGCVVTLWHQFITVVDGGKFFAVDVKS